MPMPDVTPSSVHLGHGKEGLVRVGTHFARQQAIFERFVSELAKLPGSIPGLAILGRDENPYLVTIHFLGVGYSITRVFEFVQPEGGEPRALSMLRLDQPAVRGSAVTSVTIGGESVWYDDDGRVADSQHNDLSLTLPADSEAVFCHLALGKPKG
jgi:hypothetical protein